MESFSAGEIQNKMRHVKSNSSFSSDSLETCRDRSGILFKCEVREKIRDLENRINSITATKEIFLERFHIAHKNLENMMQSLCLEAKKREQELKSHLQKIRRLKILEWNRQLELCEQAEETLRSTKGNFFRTVHEVQVVYNSFARSIGFIDSDEIRFGAKEEGVLRDLLNFGMLSFGCVKKSIEILNPKLAFGGRGKNIGEFYQPWGICTDSAGRILVTDRGNNRIQAFDGCGKFLFQFGKSGSAHGEFYHPAGIAVYKKYRIIVSDEKNHRVQVFSFRGRFLNAFGRKGSKAGEFQNPWDVSVSENGDIAVSDYSNCRIQFFNSYGVFLNQFFFDERIPDSKLGVRSRGIAFKPDGSLLVTSTYCIWVYKEFTEMRRIDGKNSEVSKYKSVACNSQGMFTVADGTNNRVQVFDEYGDLIRSFAVAEKNSERLVCLRGISFLSEGSIVLTDSGNHRILVFEF